jgi:hypothetical protein
MEFEYVLNLTYLLTITMRAPSTLISTTDRYSDRNDPTDIIMPANPKYTIQAKGRVWKDMH